MEAVPGIRWLGVLCHVAAAELLQIQGWELWIFRFNVILDAWPYLVKGLGITLPVALLLARMILGPIVWQLRLSGKRVVFGVAAGNVALLGNTPALVQLIWVHYCLPILVGIGVGGLARSTETHGGNLPRP